MANGHIQHSERQVCIGCKAEVVTGGGIGQAWCENVIKANLLCLSCICALVYGSWSCIHQDIAHQNVCEYL